MNTIERVMRVMTHLNIGAALGMAVWVIGSGLVGRRGRAVSGTRRSEAKARHTATLFLAAHAAVVTLLYGAALASGDGFAIPPIPPDTLPHPSTSSLARANPAVTAEPDLAPSTTSLAVSHELAPPWTHDDAGEADFSKR